MEKTNDDTTQSISRSSSSSSISSSNTSMQPAVIQQQQQQQQQSQEKQSPQQDIIVKDVGHSKTKEAGTSSIDSNDVRTSTFRTKVLPIVLSLFVWPGMIVLPLLLSSPYSPMSYRTVFPAEWYEIDTNDTNQHPKVLGLVLGIVAVAIGQFITCIFFYYLRKYTNPIPVQSKGVTQYTFVDGLKVHLGQPEGFGLLGTYLSATWMLRWMPLSYYNFHGTIQYECVFGCLLLQDFLQFLMHRMEHAISAEFYKMSHKPHHKFINPIMFDAFNGSITDTVCMILIPLFTTAHIMRHCNVWTYMAFGSIYANWLTLIHSEYVLPWDTYLFHPLKFGTAADHHVHHKFFIFNYGHLFMYWDIVFGTYRSPESFGPKAFTLPTSSSSTMSTTKL